MLFAHLPSERTGVERPTPEMDEFLEFIDETYLIDLPLGVEILSGQIIRKIPPGLKLIIS